MRSPHTWTARRRHTSPRVGVAVVVGLASWVDSGVAVLPRPVQQQLVQPPQFVLCKFARMRIRDGNARVVGATVAVMHPDEEVVPIVTLGEKVTLGLRFIRRAKVLADLFMGVPDHLGEIRRLGAGGKRYQSESGKHLSGGHASRMGAAHPCGQQRGTEVTLGVA
jgi:hypothetical protein